MQNNIRQAHQKSPDYALFLGNLYIGYNTKNTTCQYEKSDAPCQSDQSAYRLEEAVYTDKGI